MKHTNLHPFFSLIILLTVYSYLVQDFDIISCHIYMSCLWHHFFLMCLIERWYRARLQQRLSEPLCVRLTVLSVRHVFFFFFFYCLYFFLFKPLYLSVNTKVPPEVTLSIVYMGRQAYASHSTLTDAVYGCMSYNGLIH